MIGDGRGWPLDIVVRMEVYAYVCDEVLISPGANR